MTTTTTTPSTTRHPIIRYRRWFFAATLPLTLLLGGCSLSLGGSSAPPPPPVGVYKSTDRGDTWTTKNLLLTTSATARPNLNATSVVTLVMDPTDRQTLYLGSQGQGLYYTYDAAESWWTSGPIRVGSVNAVAVPNDPALRSTVYLATANRILKTTDGGRFWEQQYYDTRLSEQVLTLAVNQQTSGTVYAGMTTGDILKSADGGKSWAAIVRLPDKVTKLLTPSLNQNLIYAVLNSRGVWKTIDAGKTWTDTGDGLKVFSGATAVHDVAIDPARPDTVLLATDYGLVRTTDGGATWSPLALLTPAGKAKISALAINPLTPAEVYYTTDSTLYRSSDAGEHWETRTLPVSGGRTILLVDPKLPNILYLGIYRPVQQQGGFGF